MRLSDVQHHEWPHDRSFAWPPPPEPLILPGAGDPEDAVPIVDRLTLLFQARFEWVLAESLGLPSPLDHRAARPSTRRNWLAPWRWFHSR